MMGIKRRLTINYLIPILILLMFLEGIFIYYVKDYFYGSMERNLTSRINVTTGFFNKYLQEDASFSESGLKGVIENYSRNGDLELQFIDTNGNLLMSSTGFSSQRKIATADYIGALGGKISVWRGKNDITGEKVMAVSGPIMVGNSTYGILRGVTSLENASILAERAVLASLAVFIVIIAFVVLLSVIFGRSIINPVNEINLAARKMARGQFSERIEKQYNDEIGELADTINYMAKELSKVEEMKNEFISSISHELRTPLTAIKGWGETLLTGSLEDKYEMKMGLDIIVKETARLSQMVEQLLDFSRLQSHRWPLELSQVNLAVEFGDALNMFAARANREGIGLELIPSPDVPTIIADKNRLRQVFINILDNAVKFSPEGQKIIADIKADEEGVMVTIRDHGPGIAKSELPKVKQKFYKGKSLKAGSGIGLGLSDEIVRLHGGRLDIESEEGTTVKIWLPIKPR